jgi:hypothetical protein
MEPQESVEHQWPYLLSFLPPEEVLEKTSKTWGALTRKRAVESASDLVRLALVYGFCGYALRQTAAWAETAEIASLSNVALLRRLQKASDWLGHLLGVMLAERAAAVPSNQTRLRLIDATMVSAPGKPGPNDWRLHVEFDLAALAISEIQVTQVRGGETLSRYEFQPGELVVADRGYSGRPGLVHVVQAGAQFIVRLNSSSVPLQKPDGEPFDLLTAVRSLPEAEVGAFDLEIQPDRRDKTPAIPVRLVAVRKSEEAAEEARKKLLRKASQQRKELQPQTLELASYVLVLTSTCATDFSPQQILEIYRFRWQIELTFKRLKSLLGLGRLQAKNPELARTFLFAKLLGALLLEELTQAYLSFSPWGFRIQLHPPPLPVAYPASPSR